MNASEDNGPGLGGDDALAAEYVLGALTANERREVDARIVVDAAFARLVDGWEVRLAPLAAAYPPVEPPAQVRQALDRRLFRAAPASKPGMFASLAFWRGLTVATFAALALAIAAPLMTPEPANAPRMVASLGAEGSDVRYVAIYDSDANEIGLSHLSGARADAKDFELWMIEGNQAPKSLGVIPVGETMRMPMPADMADRMSDGMVFAISLEPSGGSTTGAPTGPVVAAGDLRSI